MAQIKLTPIEQLTEDLIVVRVGNNRRWKVITFILVIICLALTTVIIHMAFNRSSSCYLTNEPITTTTEMNTHNIINTTTDFTNTAVTLSPNDTYTTASNSILNISTTTKTNIQDIYSPADISDFSQFEKSFGLSLSHSIYYNIQHMIEIDGYVTSVTFRLFTNWNGDDPLYLFCMLTYYLDHPIAYRYPLIPERNNTEWQTITIPTGKVSVTTWNRLAIGMHDKSETNQIYAVRSVFSIHGRNITNNTKSIIAHATSGFYGVAFTYTIVRND